MTAPWPRSILPQDRDHRFNPLMDGACAVYRGFRAEDKRVIEVSAVVQDGDGRAVMIVWDGTQTRRITITDEAVA